MRSGSSSLLRLSRSPYRLFCSIRRVESAAAVSFYQSRADELTSNLLTVGLDIGGNYTGFVLIDSKATVLSHRRIDTSALKNSFEIVYHIYRSILADILDTRERCQLSNAEFVFGIEEYLKTLQFNYQTKVLFSLAQINSMLQLLVHQFLAEEAMIAPHLYDAVSDGRILTILPRPARSLYGLNVPAEQVPSASKRRIANKQSVLDFALSKSSNILWERKKDGEMHGSNYDVSDAFLIALVALHHTRVSRLQRDTLAFSQSKIKTTKQYERFIKKVLPPL